MCVQVHSNENNAATQRSPYYKRACVAESLDSRQQENLTMKQSIVIVVFAMTYFAPNASTRQRVTVTQPLFRLKTASHLTIRTTLHI